MWRDPAWILDMLQAAQKVLEYAIGLTETSFLASSRDQDAIVRQLTILGEAAKRVSPDFRNEHPEIPWKKIAGTRDVIVHDYFHVDSEKVWRIVQEDLPDLIKALVRIVPPEERGSQ
jgi:uncharacterized protein with HEPN domain